VYKKRLHLIAVTDYIITDAVKALIF